MKSITVLLIVITSLVSGCIVTEPRHPVRHDRDRDGDGIPNSQDRHPDNPYRD